MQSFFRIQHYFCFMNRNEAIKQINKMGGNHSPFFFVIDFEINNCWVSSPEEAFQNNILFDFNNKTNFPLEQSEHNKIKFKKRPIPLTVYKTAFNRVVSELNMGNSYLVNLTFSTPIETKSTLNEIFHAAKARYRLFYKNQFVVFSPEAFVKIENGNIYTFPMKGTIDATIDNAHTKLLNNHKEMAEHATIVDLLRNDLSRVATEVKVDRYRYIDRIVTSDNELLQVSSQISGKLPQEYYKNLGDIIFDLLPAGSVSGAPKPKTLEIISKTELHQRGFYTGIAGYFDGQSLDSCVLIRYIESNNDSLVYKSGGGITSQSIAQQEYNELNDKIYVPIA